MDGGTVVIWAMLFLQAIVVVMFLLQEITNCGDAGEFSLPSSRLSPLILC